MLSSAAMFDTSVLAYAVADLDEVRRASRDEAHFKQIREMQQASRQLLVAQPIVRVSAQVWAELLRSEREQRERRLDEIGLRIQVESIDRRVATIAAGIFKLWKGQPDYCAKCYASSASVSCTKCGKVGSSEKRLADITIAAHAEADPTVEFLYAYDNDIHALTPWLKQCKVERPPHSGGSLFAKST
jgi:hypothetical protein